MMLSVICPTNRCGGLDLLARSLASQTYTDWELILADAIKPFRKNHTFPGGMRVMWLDAHFSDDLSCSYMRAINLAVEHARGDVLVFIPDFAWLHESCLATHAEMQRRHGGPVLLDHQMVRHPDVPGLPFYGQHRNPSDSAILYTAEVNATTARYVRDLASGKLDPFMWSLEHIDNPLALPVTHRHLPCTVRQPGDYNWISLKNESYPTELVLDMNGFDEKFDRSHTWQDAEFAKRLKLRGVEVFNGPAETGLLTVVDPRRFLNVKHMPEVFGTNRELCEAAGSEVNPGFSLRERRKARLANG